MCSTPTARDNYQQCKPLSRTWGSVPPYACEHMSWTCFGNKANNICNNKHMAVEGPACAIQADTLHHTELQREARGDREISITIRLTLSKTTSASHAKKQPPPGREPWFCLLFPSHRPKTTNYKPLPGQEPWLCLLLVLETSPRKINRETNGERKHQTPEAPPPAVPSCEDAPLTTTACDTAAAQH